MNKSELIEVVAGRLGEGRSVATKAVDAVFDEIQRAVSKGERVAVTGFGVFEKRDRAARTARNPATGATVKVKKTSVPAFRAGQGFKDVVSGAKKLAKLTEPAAGRASATGTRATTAVRATAGRAASAVKSTAAKTTAARSTAAKSTAAKSTAAKTTRAAAKPAATRATKPAATRTAAVKAPAAKKTAGKATAARATAKPVVAAKSAAKKAGKKK